jgi:hypothetical protein
MLIRTIHTDGRVVTMYVGNTDHPGQARDGDLAMISVGPGFFLARNEGDDIRTIDGPASGLGDGRYTLKPGGHFQYFDPNP